MLKKLGLESSKPIGKPMVTNYKLSNKDESSSTEKLKYRSMIGGF